MIFSVQHRKKVLEHRKELKASHTEENYDGNVDELFKKLDELELEESLSQESTR